jgi:hypothetical protein
MKIRMITYKPLHTTHNMHNAGYERFETLFVSRILAKYCLENINKTVILTSRQYLAMRKLETTNLLSPHCAYCQRCAACKKTLPEKRLSLNK